MPFMTDPLGELLLFIAAAAGGTLITLLLVYVGLNSLAGSRAATYGVCFASVFILEAVFRVREYADKSIDLQIIIKVLSWLYIFGFGLTRLPRYIGSLVSLPNAFWILFFGWALYSSSYSPNPAYSVVAIFSVIAFWLYFLSLLPDSDDVAVLLSLAAAAAAIAFCSLIVYFAVPQLGRMSEWHGNVYAVGTRLSGITGTPNAMGEVAAFGLLILFLCWRGARERLGRALSLSCALVLGLALIMSYSRMSMGAVLVILGLRRMMRTRYLPWVAFWLICGIVCLLLLLPYSEQVMIALSREGDAAEIETGTARLQIWDTVIKLAEMKFWTGWGYGSSVFILPHYSSYMRETPPHAHDILLQIWLTMGAIGVLLFVTAFVLQLVQASLRRDSVAVALLGFVAINGLMEPGAFAGIASIPTIALAIAIARSCRYLTAIPPHQARMMHAVGMSAS
jgi:O-antigen ligase